MTTTDPAAERVDGIRAVWSAGSYVEVGDMWARVGQELATELSFDPGLDGARVLDAACGTGNTTLALARGGAAVVGVDLTGDLLAVARERAQAAGLAVGWREGDLLDLPVGDDEFDVVTSTFGAFTADEPHRCAAELARVCRPGGTIALTAWERHGPFEEMRSVVFDRHPELAEVPRPDASAWAEHDGLRDRFSRTSADLVDLAHREVALPFDSVEQAVAFYVARSGPTMMARAAVEGVGGDWSAVESAVVEAWDDLAHPTGDGIVLVLPYARALLRVR